MPHQENKMAKDLLEVVPIILEEGVGVVTLHSIHMVVEVECPLILPLMADTLPTTRITRLLLPVTLAGIWAGTVTIVVGMEGTLLHMNPVMVEGEMTRVRESNVLKYF